MLGRYGSNINQLARAANMSGELPTGAALLEIAVQVRAMRDSLVLALGRRRAGGD